MTIPSSSQETEHWRESRRKAFLYGIPDRHKAYSLEAARCCRKGKREEKRKAPCHTLPTFDKKGWRQCMRSSIGKFEPRFYGISYHGISNSPAPSQRYWAGCSMLPIGSSSVSWQAIAVQGNAGGSLLLAELQDGCSEPHSLILAGQIELRDKLQMQSYTVILQKIDR